MDARLRQTLQQVVHESLGGRASKALLGRLDAVLDAAGDDEARLRNACLQIEKMVGLFVGEQQARAISARCKAVLGSV